MNYSIKKLYRNKYIILTNYSVIGIVLSVVTISKREVNEMFVLKGIEQLDKAIIKAKKLRPRVKFDRFGRYRVSGSSGGYYTVICRKDERGTKAVECTCKGGEKGLVCYHAAAALSLHVGLARQRQTV